MSGGSAKRQKRHEGDCHKVQFTLDAMDHPDPFADGTVLPESVQDAIWFVCVPWYCMKFSMPLHLLFQVDFKVVSRCYHQLARGGDCGH